MVSSKAGRAEGVHVSSVLQLRLKTQGVAGEYVETVSLADAASLQGLEMKINLS